MSRASAKPAESFGAASRVPRGYTLAEVVVVLAVIAIVSTIAIPRFSRTLTTTRLRSAAERLVLDFDQARRQAKANGANVTITFAVAQSRYTVSNLTHLDFAGGSYLVELSQQPYGVKTTQAEFGGDASVTFNGYGIPDSDGGIRLRAGADTLDLALDPATGLLAIQ